MAAQKKPKSFFERFHRKFTKKDALVEIEGGAALLDSVGTVYYNGGKEKLASKKVTMAVLVLIAQRVVSDNVGMKVAIDNSYFEGMVLSGANGTGLSSAERKILTDVALGIVGNRKWI